MTEIAGSFCATAIEWIVPTLAIALEAAVIINADTGAIVHKNEEGFRLLSSTNDLAAPGVTFGSDDKLWGVVCSEIQSCEPTTMTLSIQGQTAVSLRLTKYNPCKCGCSETYLVGYVTELQSECPSENMQRLQATIDASFDAMFTIDETGKILLTNQAAINTFGYSSSDDFLGKNISMICGGEHKARHDEYLKRYLETGITRIMGKKRTVPALRKDGTEFSVELGIVELPQNNGGANKRLFSAFIQDLSLKEQYQTELLQQENITNGLINASFDPMFQIDQRGVIRVVNDAAISLFGYSREEMIGANVSLLCGHDHGAKHDGYLKRYLETGQKRIIGRKRATIAKRKDGAEFDIELGVQEVLLENGERAFCGFIRDLTQQNLMKEGMQRQCQLIQNQFFGAPSADDQPGQSAHAHRRAQRSKKAPSQFSVIT